MEVGQLKKDVEEKRSAELAEADGPLYALQMAQDTLRERYARLLKKNEELQKSVEQAMARIVRAFLFSLTRLRVFIIDVSVV